MKNRRSILTGELYHPDHVAMVVPDDRKFVILWPEKRVVGAEQIKSWYSDAVANNQATKKDLTDPMEMAHELHYVGIITLGKSE